MRLAQQGEVFVKSAVVFGYAHLVVVHHNDYACAKFGSHVQPLESLTAAQTAVAYQGYDVLLGAAHVACLLQTSGQSNGSGGVAYLKLVIHGRLQWTAVAGDVVDATRLGEPEGTSGEHLVGVRLVGHVEHHLVCWEVEHPAKGYGRFGDTEVGTHVSAVCAHSVQYAVADFFGQHFQLFVVELFGVVRLVDFLYIHIYILYVWFYAAKLLHPFTGSVIPITEIGNTFTFWHPHVATAEYAVRYVVRCAVRHRTHYISCHGFFDRNHVSFAAFGVLNVLFHCFFLKYNRKKL